MFLKRIEIFGFKSFADRIAIEFTDGITALLGPNGCGKSNIVDAIKWVLGEQSVRNMRAERMEDIIFSGADTRKALNIAEVTLVIANENGVLDMERPEIAIRRRIFRDGESEYFLNGASVRLKEIRELFFDTGVGKSAYSVMEQGRIDQVLSTRPEDRRYIFEEAAGITKFKMRGSEAERKLARTDENMSQVENILHEVRRNYENLKKQTGKTLEYRRLKELIFNLNRDLKLLQWHGLEANREKKAKRLESRSRKHAEIIGAINTMKEAIAAELDAVNSMESQTIEIRKRLYGLDLEKDSQEEQLRNLKERRNENEEALQTARTREKNAVDILASLKAQKAERESDLEKCGEELQSVEAGILGCRDTIGTVENHIKNNDDETAKVNENLAGEERRREGLQDSLRTLTDDIVRELDRQLADSDDARDTRKSLEAKLAEALKELQIRLDGRARLFQDQTNFSDGEAALNLLSTTAADLARLGESLDELVRLFEEFRQSGTHFLEDFLAPEGIITRKRELDEKIHSSTAIIRDYRNRLTDLKEEKANLIEKLNEARKNLEELRVTQARITEQVAAARKSLESLARECQSAEGRLKDVQQQMQSEENKTRQLDNQSEAITAKQKELKNDQAQLRKELSGLETGIAAENKKMTSREVSLKELNEQRGKLEVEQERFRLESEHLSEEIQQLLEDFRDSYSRDLHDYADLVVDRPSKKIRIDLSAAKDELKHLGPVNLMAPEEFAEVSERHEFLSNQLDDLRKAKDHLTRITEGIRRESAELFMATYSRIRENFHTMFRRLFGGGRAEVRLTDHENPLTSGLEIYAQPPGKKLENISLLSGGEKSLCGVALMFATFLVKPSPFCILDEIDAALDETNIQRFINLLTEFGRKSQFVVITHNKKTVTCASSLMGVTMQESGVSQIITLKLNNEEQEVDSEKPLAAG